MRHELERQAKPDSVPTNWRESKPASADRQTRGFHLSEEARAGLIFVSPFIIGFLLFTAYPLIASLYLSFTTYDVINPPVWIGLGNFQKMLTDERFSKTLVNTLVFTVMHVPTAIPIALGL